MKPSSSALQDISSFNHFSSLPFQAPSPSSLRFFAHTQIPALCRYPSLEVYVNEKFGVIFTFTHQPTPCTFAGHECAVFVPPVRAPRASGRNWHQKSRKYVGCLPWLRGDVPMGEPLRRLCILRDDTLVQYAACLLLCP